MSAPIGPETLSDLELLLILGLVRAQDGLFPADANPFAQIKAKLTHHLDMRKEMMQERVNAYVPQSSIAAEAPDAF